MGRNRSPQDEKLVTAIFSSSRPGSDLSDMTLSDTPTPAASTPNHSTEHVDSPYSPEGSTHGSASPDAQSIENAVSANTVPTPAVPRIYGAQQSNLIVDARPTVNAYANHVAGMGSENMDYYKLASKAFLGIDNIHVMRSSLNKVVEALKDSDITSFPPAREQLAKSGWLQHICNILEGGSLIARQVGINHSHVLIHCSDGWDRTSQLSALSQLCLDPYYRTLEGFCILVEKDWLSFGHMFRHRSGFLGSDKWFEVENERVGGNRQGVGSNGSTIVSGGGGNALENAFLKAQGFFKKKNDSRESLDQLGDEELQAADSPTLVGGRVSGASKEDKALVKVKEISPVFHQFLDATYQLIHQHPTRFEFNERFLRRLLYHLYSCQYGTFLWDSERERVEAHAAERTRSVWDYFLSRKAQFVNDKYDPEIDDSARGKERLLFPKLGEVRWWSEVFGRTDAEMNGPTIPGQPVFSPSSDTFANGGGNDSTEASMIEVDFHQHGNDLNANSASSTPIPVRVSIGSAGTQFSKGLTAGMERMGIRGSPSPSRPRSPRGKESMEVEMQ